MTVIQVHAVYSSLMVNVLDGLSVGMDFDAEVAGIRCPEHGSL